MLLPSGTESSAGLCSAGELARSPSARGRSGPPIARVRAARPRSVDHVLARAPQPVCWSGEQHGDVRPAVRTGDLDEAAAGGHEASSSKAVVHGSACPSLVAVSTEPRRSALLDAPGVRHGQVRASR